MKIFLIVLTFSIFLLGCNTISSSHSEQSNIKCTITSKTGDGCTVWRYTKWCNEVGEDELPLDTLYLTPEQCNLKK